MADISSLYLDLTVDYELKNTSDVVIFTSLVNVAISIIKILSFTHQTETSLD